MPCRETADVHVFLKLLDGLVGVGNLAEDSCDLGNVLLHYCAQRNDYKLLLALCESPNKNLDDDRYVDLLRRKNMNGQRPLDLALYVNATECINIINIKHRLMDFDPGDSEDSEDALDALDALDGVGTVHLRG